MRDWLHIWDLFLYRFINGRLTFSGLDGIALFFSSPLLWSSLLGLGIAYALLARDRRTLHTLACVVLAFSISDSLSSYVVKPFFQRVRPCHYLPDARRVNGICGSEFGMPSNHAANGMATTTVIAVFASRFWFIAALVSTLIVGFTRVYLGVHFPGDVLSGFVFGMGYGVAAIAILYPFMTRKKR